MTQMTQMAEEPTPRTTQQPLYAQLKQSLSEAIARGELPPGAQLPSHHTLTREHSVSYMTVRRAISELINDGTLYAVHGKGVYVATPKQPAESGLLVSFSEEMMRRGQRPSSRLLAQELVSADASEAITLGLAVGAPLIRLVRLRLANGEPIALQTSLLPHDRCPGLLAHDLGRESLFALLRQYGLRPMTASGAVGAALATAEEAALLGIELPAALLVTEQRTCLDDGTPIEWTRSVYRGDRFQLPR
jgi:GntR family transcriptional regulator